MGKTKSRFGSVTNLPSGRWRATWRSNGQNFAGPRTFPTESEAWTYLATVETDLVRGTFMNPKAGKMTVKQVGAAWLKSGKESKKKSPATLSRDESILTKHVYPTIGKASIGSVKKVKVQSLVDSWTGTPETIRRQASAMGAMFNYAVNVLEIIPKSPARNIEIPDPVKVDRYHLTPDDVARIAEGMDERYRASVWIGAVTGARWNEVYALSVEDIDVSGSAINVRGGITRGTGGAPEPSSGSRKAPARRIPIKSALVDVLTDHLAKLTPGALLFPDADGSLMRYANWRYRFWLPALRSARLMPTEEDALISDKLPIPGFHDLRRTAVTQLVATTDITTSMARLGVQTSRVLLEIYAKAVDERELVAAEVMEDFMMSHGANAENGQSHISHTEEMAVR